MTNEERADALTEKLFHDVYARSDVRALIAAALAAAAATERRRCAHIADDWCDRWDEPDKRIAAEVIAASIRGGLRDLLGTDDDEEPTP